MVYVNAGDSKGQQGKVLKVDAQKQRAIVEGVNISKKATKPNAKNPQGGIIEQESAIHISNLQVLDPIILAGCKTEKNKLLISPTSGSQ